MSTDMLRRLTDRRFIIIIINYILFDVFILSLLVLFLNVVAVI